MKKRNINFDGSENQANTCFIVVRNASYEHETHKAPKRFRNA